MGKMNMTTISSSVTSPTTLLDDFKHYSTTVASNITNDTSEAYMDVEENGINQRLWNFTKTSVTPLAETTLTSFDTSSSSTYTPTTTTDSFDEFGPPEGIEYIFVPLGVVVFVIILSAVVWVAISLL